MTHWNGIEQMANPKAAEALHGARVDITALLDVMGGRDGTHVAPLPNCSMSAHPVVHWIEGGEARSARWLSESGAPPARCVVIADDHLTADEAYGLACQGAALLWRGGLPQARPTLRAVGSRGPRRAGQAKEAAASSPGGPPGEAVPLPPPAPPQHGRPVGAGLV